MQECVLYEETPMVSLLCSLFSNALKTNDSLYFAVLTGCLRISKESIFTGLNNLNVMTITDSYFSEVFGFTDSEVKKLLAYYHLEDSFETMREWYDGYQSLCSTGFLLSQIADRKYDAVLKRDGMERIMKYEIAFYKKNCRIILE